MLRGNDKVLLMVLDGGICGGYFGLDFRRILCLKKRGNFRWF